MGPLLWYQPIDLREPLSDLFALGRQLDELAERP
jgi:hypothetical protein